jgi:hypothetical protein
LSHSLNARLRGVEAVRREAERGSAALFVAIFAPAMIFMAGLVIDGGARLEAKQRASDIAEQAARAGAGQCDVALLRSQGICFVDKGLVPAAVAPYRNSPGVTDFDWVPLADPTTPAGQRCPSYGDYDVSYDFARYHAEVQDVDDHRAGRRGRGHRVVRGRHRWAGRCRERRWRARAG